MMTVEILVAVVLLAGPDLSTERRVEFAVPSGGIGFYPHPVEPWAAVVRPAILALSLANETLDQRERHMLATDVIVDLEELRRRWQQFKTAPILEDAERLPDRIFAVEALRLNRAHWKRLDARRAIDLVNADAISAELLVIDRLYVVWDAVRGSRADYYFVTVRRQSLSLLRDLIGPEAFYGGRMPPAVR